jgi:hypothetical protein
MIRQMADLFAERFSKAVFTGEVTCIIRQKETVVYEGVCYASGRRRMTTPKVETDSRSLVYQLTLKLPKGHAYIKAGCTVELFGDIADELKANYWVVKDNANSSQYQYTKNLILEASGEKEHEVTS